MDGKPGRSFAHVNAYLNAVRSSSRQTRNIFDMQDTSTPSSSSTGVPAFLPYRANAPNMEVTLPRVNTLEMEFTPSRAIRQTPKAYPNDDDDAPQDKLAPRTLQWTLPSTGVKKVPCPDCITYFRPPSVIEQNQELNCCLCGTANSLVTCECRELVCRPCLQWLFKMHPEYMTDFGTHADDFHKITEDADHLLQRLQSRRCDTRSVPFGPEVPHTTGDDHDSDTDKSSEGLGPLAEECDVAWPDWPPKTFEEFQSFLRSIRPPQPVRPAPPGNPCARSVDTFDPWDYIDLTAMITEQMRTVVVHPTVLRLADNLQAESTTVLEADNKGATDGVVQPGALSTLLATEAETNLVCPCDRPCRHALRSAGCSKGSACAFCHHDSHRDTTRRQRRGCKRRGRSDNQPIDERSVVLTAVQESSTCNNNETVSTTERHEEEATVGVVQPGTSTPVATPLADEAACASAICNNDDAVSAIERHGDEATVGVVQPGASSLVATPTTDVTARLEWAATAVCPAQPNTVNALTLTNSTTALALPWVYDSSTTHNHLDPPVWPARGRRTTTAVQSEGRCRAANGYTLDMPALTQRPPTTGVNNNEPTNDDDVPATARHEDEVTVGVVQPGAPSRVAAPTTEEATCASSNCNNYGAVPAMERHEDEATVGIVQPGASSLVATPTVEVTACAAGTATAVCAVQPNTVNDSTLTCATTALLLPGSLLDSTQRSTTTGVNDNGLLALAPHCQGLSPLLLLARISPPLLDATTMDEPPDELTTISTASLTSQWSRQLLQGRLDKVTRDEDATDGVVQPGASLPSMIADDPVNTAARTTDGPLTNDVTTEHGKAHGPPQL